MTPAAHREICHPIVVVAHVGHKTAVGCQCRVDLGCQHRFDLRGEFIIGDKSLNLHRLGTIRIADDQTLALGVIERCPVQRAHAVGGNDYLEVTDRAHFIAEPSGEVRLERQVVSEIFTGP
jgi:hypothetical protein